ncbi:MAG: S-layer homology domain-containing protein [Thermoanaerobaculia bacterium]
MNSKRLAPLLSIALVLASTRTAAAQSTVTVHIDTSAANGTQGRIAFTFVGASLTAPNSVQILNFSTDATLGLPETEGGLVTGDLILRINPAPFTQIDDGFFYNELVLPTTTLSFGNQIDFSIQLTENAVGASIPPDEFAFYLLTQDGQRLFATADPLGADSLFTICATGESGGELNVFAPAMVQDRNINVVVAPTFGDVPFTNIFHRFIERIADAGITAGCNLAPPRYCPQNVVTREQMAVFVLRALGIAPDASGAQVFDDVPPSSPLYGFIQVFSRLGITAGCNTNPPLFCPGNSVTREQMAVFVLRALGLQPDSSGPQVFDDVPPSHPLYGFIQVFSRLGITAGCNASPPQFCPTNPVTREQMAAFLVRAFILELDIP